MHLIKLATAFKFLWLGKSRKSVFQYMKPQRTNSSSKKNFKKEIIKAAMKKKRLYTLIKTQDYETVGKYKKSGLKTFQK